MYSESSPESNGTMPVLPPVEPEPLIPDLRTPKLRGEGHIKLDAMAALVSQYGSHNGSNHKDTIRLFRTFNDLFYRSPAMNLIIDELDKRLVTLVTGLGVKVVLVEDCIDEETRGKGGRGIF